MADNFNSDAFTAHVPDVSVLTPPSSQPKKPTIRRPHNANKPSPLPVQFDWSGDKNTKTRSLIDLMEKPENFKVLFGMKKGENSSSDSKSTVYQRIAWEIWPQYCELNLRGTWTCVQGKITILVKEYKKEAKNLQQTGNGVQEGEDNEDRELWWYIPSTGPDQNTPPEAHNIWEAIEQRFLFFPHLYQFLSTRPNVIPPVVTTGVTPSGRQTVFLQQPAATMSTPIFCTVSDS
ncbi:hypothetical protein E1B28_008446 [Marasmius oreades]|uniref:Uncharacterized protein n=1 Tax=Marasmius oreades TaxID=181124 RepID=A0A9P7RZ22_9AGAR|nr:uncharacterized protein E1B28_008446 [Marasmius oreades]KAG7092065.1 hypothetical protein E1B28_008446 [Marasmius oreades]